MSLIARNRFTKYTVQKRKEKTKKETKKQVNREKERKRKKIDYGHIMDIFLMALKYFDGKTFCSI